MRTVPASETASSGGAGRGLATSPRPRDLAVFLFAAAFPTLTSWIYFVLLSGERWMLPAYAASKVVQFSLPLVWVLWVEKRWIDIRGAPRRGFGIGVASGAAILSLHLAVYYGFLRHSPILTEAPGALAEKLQGLGARSLARFVLLAAFISFLHSFFEEYYWRWFVYGELRRWVRPLSANLLASLAFMAHHVVVIDAYIPARYFWSATLFFSLCVAAGGSLWAWIYERTGALYGGWVSHVCVDVAIMITGYDLAFAGD